VERAVPRSGTLDLDACQDGFILYDPSLQRGSAAVNHPIHPDYMNCKVLCSCGQTFMTRAVQPELRVDICGACHPLFTGRQKFVDSAGRIQRFQEKFKWQEGAAAEASKKKAKKAVAATAADDE
jgi:ribosomal protein L31